MQIRGPRLKDTVDVAALKPCNITLVEGKIPNPQNDDALSYHLVRKKTLFN